jgi:hypothetical protein
MEESRFQAVAEIWLHDDAAGDAFDALERELVGMMARHGGRIEHAVRIDPGPAAADLPYEIHVVSFPDRAAFDAYRADPATRALGPRRDRLIARTVLRTGRPVQY